MSHSKISPASEFYQICPYTLDQQEQLRLARAVVFLNLLGLISLPLLGAEVESLIGAACILVAATLPSILWARGLVLGLPIYPLYALTFIITHTFPLVSGHPDVLSYQPIDHLLAGIKVAGFLLFGTLVWYYFARRFPPPPRRFYAMEQRAANMFFIFVLMLAIIYQAAFVLGSIWILPYQFISILRALLLGLNLLGSFYLAYAIGKRSLTRGQTYLYLALFPCFLLVTALSFLLIHVIWSLLLAFIGYTLGRRKVPWKTLIVATIILAMLHAGKGDMRVRYWYQGEKISSVFDFPARISEWLTNSFDKLDIFQPDESLTPYRGLEGEQQGSDILERASVIHLFLLVQSKAGTEVPLLSGRTYRIIPLQLIPSIFYAAKVTPLQGTRILNIHYGKQRPEDTQTTTIGWGLVNEAYANFGLTGLWLLAAVIGFCSASVSSWCLFTPILSARTLFAVIVMAMTLQTEWSAGTFAASLFQTSCVLLLVTFALMKRYTFIIEELELPA